MKSPITPGLPDLASEIEQFVEHHSDQTAFSLHFRTDQWRAILATLRASPQAGPTMDLTESVALWRELKQTVTGLAGDQDAALRAAYRQGIRDADAYRERGFRKPKNAPPVEDVARLRAALEPFAKRAEHLEPDWSDDECHWHPAVGTPVTVGHLRAAQEALAPAPSQDAPRETEGA